MEILASAHITPGLYVPSQSCLRDPSVGLGRALYFTYAIVEFTESSAVTHANRPLSGIKSKAMSTCRVSVASLAEVTMSSSSVKSDNFFLILLRDVPNAQRAKHTPKHMEINIPLIESGYISASIRSFF